MSGPLVLNDASRSTPPVKYTERFWVRGVSDVVPGLYRLMKMRIRCRLDDDGGDPVYGPFELPGLEGYKLAGVYAHPFVLSDSSADPTSSDGPVVRPVFALRGPRSFSVYLYTVGSPGSWPGVLSNSGVEFYNINAAANRLGGPGDFNIGVVPGTASYLRPARVVHIKTESLGDPSDPSGVNVYQLVLSSGVRVRVEVNVLADQPVLGSPWPLDQEEGVYGFQVGVVHNMQQRKYPKRNAYVVGTLSDLPSHNLRGVQAGRPLVVVSKRLVSNLPENSDLVQEVVLSDGQSIRVSTAVTVVVGREFDPSGVDPSAVDPSAQQQQAYNPAEWWEFDAFLILAPDSEQDGTLGGGYAVDPWAF